MIVPRRPGARSQWAGWLALGVVAWSCGGSKKPGDAPEHKPPYWANSPTVCGVDEVREYFCDELVPQGSVLAPSAPYGDCPRQVDHHVGEIAPAPPVAVFDRSYTDWMRRRAPPGHSCCYSWCSLAKIVDPSTVNPSSRCGEALSMREQYCLAEPESGSSQPYASPLERCPAAIAPPAGAVFSAPAGALLDPQASFARRGQGFRECCYAWCSIAPPNTGLQGR